MAKIRTHYDNLNISRTAPPEIIKAAYKALAQKYHPDRNPNNPEAHKIMQIINKAYEVLSDPVRRAEHDRWIAEQEAKIRAHQSAHQQNNQHHTQQNYTHQNYTHQNTTNTQNQSTNDHHNYTNSNNTQYNRRHNGQGTYSAGEKHTVNNSGKKPSFWSMHGRLRRKTFALLFVPIFIFSLPSILVSQVIFRESINGTSGDLLAATLIITILSLPFYFLAFISIKRLHDCNHRGWWMLFPLMPILLLFMSPTKGVNRFGFDPRKDYFDENIDFETDYSFIFLICFRILYVFGQLQGNYQQPTQDSSQQTLYSDSNTQDSYQSGYQTASTLSVDKPTYTDNKPETNSQEPDLYLAKLDYDNAVENINNVWNNLHPSVRDFLREEQRAINKERELKCTAFGNSQSKNKSIATAYRYICEIPQLNERAEYLKTQLATIILPPIRPLPLPRTGATNNPSLYGDSPLQIKTATGSHYWVKIVDAYNENDEVASYFIRGGETLDVDLPIGDYMVKYAYGNTWYGKENLFGEDTNYAKADEVLKFDFGQGYTIELIQQFNGNLHTTIIDKGSF